MYNRELYIPRIAKIKEIKTLTRDTKLFRVVFKNKGPELSLEHEFLPGQFVQVSVFGAGEVPISIASSPQDEGFLELSIRRVGYVSSHFHKLNVGNEIGIRGPYGNYFLKGHNGAKDFLFAGGGCGLAPLRSLIKYMLSDPRRFPRLTVLYGARTKDDILFRDELYALRESDTAEVNLSVDCGPADPGCEIGVVTTLFKKFKDLRDTLAFLCGPSLMMHFAIQELLNLRVKPEHIILSLERYMKCGVGKCGHCYLKDKYVCTDGPVFSYKDLKELGVEI